MSDFHTEAVGAMSIDMSQFYRVFFEEAAEHLAEMENLLLSIDCANASLEELNAIFRAAHSIKGGSGTFGFSDMTQVTHVAESLLDKVHKHELELTREMVDALLQAGDVLKVQLARHQGDTGQPEPQSAEVCSRIEALLTSPAARAGINSPITAALRVRFSWPEERTHIELDNLLAEIRLLGRMSDVSESAADETKTFEFTIETNASAAEIAERFGFLLAPEQVSVAQVAAAAEADPGYGFFEPVGEPAPKASEPAADSGYGFFVDLPQQPSAEAPAFPPRNQGRRATDRPEAEGARAGRRETDKIVTSAQSESLSIRVGIEKVDQLINQVGELVITQAVLAQSVSQLDPLLYQSLFKGMGDLERNTRDLQESVMSIRMMPVAFVFNRFPRMVRDLAAKMGKQVRLVTEGESTELDKGLIEKISDPLTHLVRNAVDHGIESPQSRRAAGKPEQGTVTLSASHQGGNILIEVSDDGAGLDRDKILAKARGRGLTLSDTMSDQEVWQLIFEAGFSTAEVVTDVSGRGVGMDVVKRNIHALGGTVEISSTFGQGTRMAVRLPLTLAIMDGMSVAVGEEIYIIPLASVVESLQVSDKQVKAISGRGNVIKVREEYLPVMSLRQKFGLREAANDGSHGITVIVEAEEAKTALLVDELLGQHQVVIKSLEANYRKVPGVSGATIMGDGRVALILDVGNLVQTRAAPVSARTAASL